MSEEDLGRFLDRINSDAGFRDLLQRDPAEALEQFELSSVEKVALGLRDEDALRRLGGASDVSGYLAPGGGQAGGTGFITEAVACAFTVPPVSCIFQTCFDKDDLPTCRHPMAGAL